MLRRPAFFVPFILLLFAASCGGSDASTTPPTNNTGAAIAISPSTPPTIASGTSTTLTATVTSSDGHTVSGAAVTWSTSNATIATVDGNGSVTGVRVGTATISATSGTLSTAMSVTVIPGAATQLAVRAQPAEGAIGSPLAPQPVVEIRDAAGNLATSSTAAVTAAISNGGGSLSGTVTVSAVGGVATFSGLTVLGSAGLRRLSFTSLGLATAVSGEFNLTTPIGRFIVLDSSAISATAQQATNPAARTISVTNGGSVAFAGVTVDPVVYDAGQPTGWLSAVLTGNGTPLTLTLSFSATTLPIGTYHATVRVNAAGALNTPQSVSVTLNIVAAVNVTYGSNTEKIRILDAGGAYTPTVTALINGAVQPVSAVTFRSRTTTVATVDAAGRVTAVGAGDTWIVASLQNAADSVFVTVTRSATGPLLRANLTTYSVRSGDTVSAVYTLDPRSTSLSNATVTVSYEVGNGMFFPLSADIPSQTPQPVGASPSVGVYRISFSSTVPVTTPVAMLQLKLITRNSGLAGFITFTVTSIVNTGGTDVTSQTTSTRYPIIVR
jgi:hypothetical protein